MQATRLTVLTALSCAAVLWLAAPAKAAEGGGENLPLTNSASDTLFELMGVDIANFRVAAGGISAIDRCGIVQRRYKAISNTPLFASDVSVARRGRESLIMLRGHLLFTATSEDARANGTTTSGLANDWANHLRSALGMMGS